MISRDYGALFVSCDGCGDTDDLDTSDFDEAVAEVKRRKWRASKSGGEWVHTCPACQEKSGSPEALFR